MNERDGLLYISGYLEATLRVARPGKTVILNEDICIDILEVIHLVLKGKVVDETT